MEYNTIYISYINNSFMRIDAERSILLEIQDKFSFFVDGYRFMPKYRNGIWDGKIRLFDINKQIINCGLIFQIEIFAKKRNYKIVKDRDIISIDNNIPNDAGYKIAKKINANRVPREYQNEAVVEILRNKRIILLSAVNSGKSFIIYLITRYLNSLNKKVLIVVPSISLVTQMKKDFEDYNSNNNYGLDIHTIMSGKEKNSNSLIQISTWQSIYKLPKEWFEKFEVVFGDEAHTFKATSLIDIMNNSINCSYRIGTTGTLDDIVSNELTLRAHFGKVYQGKKSHELMTDGVSANLSINIINVNYSDKMNIEFSKMVKEDRNKKGTSSNFYNLSKKYIVTNKQRNKFIRNLAWKLTGNTVILFEFVEIHGKVLAEMLQKEGKIVYFYHGGISKEEREKIREDTEKNNNVIIIASYGTFQQGINIINLVNLIFASPSKSKIRVLQSLGRIQRKGNGINNVKAFDLGDNLYYKNKSILLEHLNKRIEYYIKEEFKYKFIEVNLKDGRDTKNNSLC